MSAAPAPESEPISPAPSIPTGRDVSTSMSVPIVYALGSNGSGQLGIGHADDVKTPQKCIFRVHQAPGFSDDQAFEGTDGGGDGMEAEVCEVKKIVAGGNHTLILTDQGRLFMAGRIDLYNGLEEIRPSTVFHEIRHLLPSYRGMRNQITDIAATWEASFAVIDQEVILSWGKGAKGELGMDWGSDATNRAVGTAFVMKYSDEGEDVKIIAIEACVAHVVALFSNGHVHGWGSCRKGQLGEQYKAKKILCTPTRLDIGADGRSLLPFVPERVILGREYTIFLKTGERPVIWGSALLSSNIDSEWLLGDDDAVVSGWSSVHILWRRSSLGAVNGVGKNDHGQLGPANLPPIRALAAGSEHCVSLTADGMVIAWGWGEHGNCGNQVDQKGNVAGRWNVIFLPQLDQGVIVKDVAGGCATTFVVCGKEEG